MNISRKIAALSVIVCITSLVIVCSPPKEELTASIIAGVKNPRQDSIVGQRILVNVEDEEVIVGEKGTVILIQKDAFLDAQGNPVNSKIEIELKELPTVDGFINARLSTLSHGKLLSTNGSYYINATSEGKQLTINPAVGLPVSFSALEKDPDMKLFKGVITPTGEVDWEETGLTETKIPEPKLKKPKELDGV